MLKYCLKLLFPGAVEITPHQSMHHQSGYVWYLYWMNEYTLFIIESQISTMNVWKIMPSIQSSHLILVICLNARIQPLTLAWTQWSIHNTDPWPAWVERGWRNNDLKLSFSPPPKKTPPRHTGHSPLTKRQRPGLLLDRQQQAHMEWCPTKAGITVRECLPPTHTHTYISLHTLYVHIWAQVRNYRCWGVWVCSIKKTASTGGKVGFKHLCQLQTSLYYT